MKYDFYESPTGEDVVLRITNGDEVHRIAFTRSELHQLDWAIRKYLEKQPLRVLKDATGGRK